MDLIFHAIIMESNETGLLTLMIFDDILEDIITFLSKIHRFGQILTYTLKKVKPSVFLCCGLM